MPATHEIYLVLDGGPLDGKVRLNQWVGIRSEDSVSDDDDWRIQGQEKYLKNVCLHFRKWQQSREGWDHDHCEFCGAKFMIGNPDALSEGYTTSDEYYWICSDCFSDFCDKFNWSIEPSEPHTL